ncbi:MAG: GNAT family N-acetyltransferase [Acidobacteriota bacterium]
MSDVREAGSLGEGLSALFSSFPYLPVVLEAGLAGRGTVWVDPAGPAAAARLDIGCYSFFAGNPESASAAALVEKTPLPREFIFPGEDVRWRARVFEGFGDRVRDRPMCSYLANALDLDTLADQASVPAGFEVRRMGLADLEQLGEHLEPHGLQVEASVERFFEQGIGFCVVRSDRVLAAATSYARTTSGVEISVACDTAYRRRGFAKAAASGLLRWCLRNGVRPHWHAANPVSQHLALALGFTEGPECPALFVKR